ncbi:MAG TPA: sugar phosphate isomerase/epimerase family protein [Isosphaeraceae bacterium]|jgi:sugar phosphate isomerase/epimerase|nr:sugar phosphate isomerase/epimerase family protein [Isosphaeraceae bacterium]
MRPNRREFLGGALALAAPAVLRGEEPKSKSKPVALGIVEYSLGRRFRGARPPGPGMASPDPVAFLDACHSLGAGGMQLNLGVRDADAAGKLRAKAEEYGMFVEGIASLPREDRDVDRFRDALRTAKVCGARVVRTGALSGRRYETFDSLAAFREFADRAHKSIERAIPVAEKLGIRLAIENHKDWRVDDFVALLKKFESEYFGVTLDFGNNLALLDDPMELVSALLPRTFATHVKDMGVEEYRDGFLLSEVPLGAGILDLPAIVKSIRSAHPDVHFSLEMITRDPLKIPCLTPKYFATFPDLPARDLARTLAMVRARASSRPLPRVAGLSPGDALAREEQNVRESLAYARDRLGL